MDGKPRLQSLQIAPGSGEPIYRQLMDQVHRLIASGRLKPGDELPSVRYLAGQLQINPMTVSKAYGGLELQGILVRQRGKTMTVALRKEGKLTVEQRLRQLQPDIDKLLVNAKQLDIDSERLLAYIKRYVGNGGN